MNDIVQILEDWDKSLADMDKGEFDIGIMTQIRFEQRDKICSAIREIKKLRAAITETLDKNGHLADGEICTLIKLKRVVPNADKEL